MHNYSRSHLSDSALDRNVAIHLASKQQATAELIADLAEIDARRRYAALGYPSMMAYCTGHLNLSEDSAAKHIHVSRVAQRVPAIFPALARGRLHLSAVEMLASRLQPDNAEELLAAATHKTKTEILKLLAERFPRPDVPTSIEPLPAVSIRPSLMSEPAEHAPGHVGVPARSNVTPLAPQRYLVTFTIGQQDQALLDEAQDLLSHLAQGCGAAEVFLRALRELLPRLRNRRYAATSRARRPTPRAAENPRCIPASVQRAVWERDGGRCSFVGEKGRRCESRRHLQFDHVLEVARGGQSTMDNLRLRCRAHNRFTAEQTFGREFMNAKIEQSRDAAEARKRAEEVVPWLQALGIRADHARQAAERCASMADATLEQRVKAALSTFAPRDVALRQASPAL